MLGHGPNDLFPYATTSLRPVGPLTRVPNINIITTGGDTLTPAAPEGAPTTLLVLGADGPLGRDELLRLLYGGQVSLEVAIAATLLALAIGTLLGSAAAYFGGWIDAVISRFTDLVMAFPILLFVIMLGSTVAPRIDGITLHGLLARGVFSLALPIGAFTWFYPARIVRSQALFFVALYLRMVRASMLEVLDEPYVRTARAKGASERRVLRRHALPNAILPIVTMIGMDIGTAVGVSIYIEAVYGLPGLGRTTLTALSGGVGYDLPVIVGVVLFTGAAIILLNIAVDLLYVVFDPRVAVESGRGRQAALGRLV